MEIEALRLRGFRNYEALDAAFVPGVNLILGDNAQGKTNLLEALVYLSTGRGFRTRREQELIRFGADFADLEADIAGAERTHTLRAVLFQGRRPRQLYRNGVKEKSFAALSGTLTTVLFCPEDLLILKAGAEKRRRFLDFALCQLRPGYEKALGEYQRLLEHKSRLVKDWRERPEYLDVLPDFNLRLCQFGAAIIAYRANYLEKLSRLSEAYHRDFSGGKETLRLSYRTVSTVENPLAPRLEIEKALLAHQETHLRAELEAGQCLTGPHRDDFEVELNGVSLKSFGSQGQVRTAAISLKLSERDIFRDDTGEMPVLLLDDVLSELDAGRQDYLINQLRGGQVLITCCESRTCPNLGAVLHIAAGAKTGWELGTCKEAL